MHRSIYILLVGQNEWKCGNWALTRRFVEEIERPQAEGTRANRLAGLLVGSWGQMWAVDRCDLAFHAVESSPPLFVVQSWSERGTTKVKAKVAEFDDFLAAALPPKLILLRIARPGLVARWPEL